MAGIEDPAFGEVVAIGVDEGDAVFPRRPGAVEGEFPRGGVAGNGGAAVSCLVQQLEFPPESLLFMTASFNWTRNFPWKKRGVSARKESFNLYGTIWRRATSPFSESV